MVKNLPVNAGDIRDTDLISGSERSPAGGHGNPSSIFASKSSGTEEAGGLQAMGSQKVRHNRVTNFHFLSSRRHMLIFFTRSNILFSHK